MFVLVAALCVSTTFGFSSSVAPRSQYQKSFVSVLCDEAVGGDERCAEFLESIPEFDTLFERKTPAEVGAMLDAYLLGEEGTNEGTGSTTTPPPSTDTVSSVDAAFNELMGA